MADRTELQETASPSVPAAGGRRVRFDRNELAGSFGDIGADLPPVIGMIPAAGLDVAGVFTMFGLMQIGTGLAYGLPMPVRPLKAMAMLVITQKIGGDVLVGRGWPSARRCSCWRPRASSCWRCRNCRCRSRIP